MDYIPLRMGAFGPQVREVQRMLRHLGFPIGEIDGQFGVKTQRMVIAFQSASELPIDGVVAANTWMALEKRVGGMEPEPQPDPPRPAPIIPPEPPIVDPPAPPRPIAAEEPPVPLVPPVVTEPAAPFVPPVVTEPPVPPVVAEEPPMPVVTPLPLPAVELPVQTVPLIDWSEVSPPIVHMPMEVRCCGEAEAEAPPQSETDHGQPWAAVVAAEVFAPVVEEAVPVGRPWTKVEE
ncbi:MAG: peptidoglycan-binding protein [Oscillospiraceae bacterium]|nr:peptidoglycan-binding protein [Oscillospiraceae bacterium]